MLWLRNMKLYFLKGAARDFEMQALIKLFSKEEIANKVIMISWKLVILFINISLGLYDVTQTKMAALHSF